MHFRSLRYAALLIPLALAGCPLNIDPVARAGDDQIVNEGDQVTLQGSGTDHDGQVLFYNWRQTGGEPVEFQAKANKGTLKFTAPATDIQLTLTFELTVTDNHKATSKPDTVTVTVNQIKFFGTAPGGPEDYEHLLTYFKQVTPENAGKWGSVEATQDVMNWDALDTAYQFARNNGLPFKFHTLIWGQQQPAWVTNLPAAQQLEEIEEWMTLVAARYPDLEMIEVVNEPTNAPPAYRDALGGTGETGFDWVIKAFELAREHFPNSQLIINEYNTLATEPLTTSYMNVINLLIERGLLDAIGEQAHFYERTNVDVIAANLDTLASTGLPIFISELDVNLANDADQANVLRDLFTLFWEHPSVAGVTHWGHLQGSVWRTNAYLIRSDDSTRPALDWLVCYLGGGADCTVPEYVHPGWQGQEFGLTLNAVDHDEGEGVVSGGTIAYTDDGDWIAFKGVEFQQGWDTVWVDYAKGNQDPGSISIHLDSLENPAAATVELPPTSGWGSADTVEQAWPSINTTHDVYIRFNGGPGVGNLNSVRFGKPIPPSNVNLVNDGSFEAAITGWNNWGNGTLSASTAQARTGSQSLQSTGRSGAGGFAAYTLTSSVSPGNTYAVSAWVFVDGTTARMARKLRCGGTDSYSWLDNNTAVVPNTWTQLTGTLAIPADCALEEATIYFENAPTGVDVYLDDVSVVPPAGANLLTNGGFEAGITGWNNWGNGTLTSSTAQVRTGSLSLQSTGRSGAGGFAAYTLTSSVSVGNSYAVSAWVLVDGTTARLARKLRCGGTDSYSWLDNNTAVVPNTWTQLTGTLQIPADCALEEATIYFENAPTGVDVYIDDASVVSP